MALNLFWSLYQPLLIIYQKFTAKNVEINCKSECELKGHKNNFFMCVASVKKNS